MNNKTLIFFVDAVRKDYITKENSPFLYDFMKNKTYMDCISQLGYSSGIHPSIFKGKDQENHNHFLVYSYADGNGPFKWMKHLAFIPENIRQFSLALLKAPYYMIKFGKTLYPKWYKKSILPIPASIIPKMAPYYKVEDFYYENDFFKVLNNAGYTNSSQPDFYNPNYGEGVGLQNWSITDNNLDFYFSYEIDPAGHYYGPNSPELLEKMKEIDKKIADLVKEAEEKYENVDLFIFSDHGMVEIVDNINVKEVLERSSLELEKDYKVFFDSTMVRFWVDDEKVKEQIINDLSSVKHLTYITDELKEKYKIRFKDRKWGDMFFLADPGYRIFPDYFAPVKFNTKGMHGYWPEHTESKGIFMTNTFKTEKKDIHVTEFMPTMLKSMGLEKLTPSDLDGESII